MTKNFDHSPFEILIPVSFARDFMDVVGAGKPKEIDYFIDGVCCGFAIACEVADGNLKLDSAKTGIEIVRGFKLAKGLEDNDD